MNHLDERTTAQRILPLVDLTSLGEDDEPADIDALCQRAVTEHGSVASVCVWPRFVAQAAERLYGTDVVVCAVANFPAGADDRALAVADAAEIVAAGGVEVDVVVPWRRLAAGDSEAVEGLVAEVRAGVGPDIVLKAILETGELVDDGLIAAAAEQALSGGADFLKTSTGKTANSATPAAVKTLVTVLAEWETSPTGPGIKVSGGVSTVAQAAEYLAIADAAFGPDWVSAATFRFGTSRLLGDLLRALGPGPSTVG